MEKAYKQVEHTQEEENNLRTTPDITMTTEE